MSGRDELRAGDLRGILHRVGDLATHPRAVLPGCEAAEAAIHDASVFALLTANHACAMPRTSPGSSWPTASQSLPLARSTYCTEELDLDADAAAHFVGELRRHRADAAEMTDEP